MDPSSQLDMHEAQDISADLLQTFCTERNRGEARGIYHISQVGFRYHTNRIEGSQLSQDEVHLLFSTRDRQAFDASHDDIQEILNHFACFDLVLDAAKQRLDEDLILQLHIALKQDTYQAKESDFALGAYKKLDNTVGGIETCAAKDVPFAMAQLLHDYNALDEVTFEDILDFHVRFETIHPFQDGNGRVGRLIMFKECLKHDIVPFIIQDEYKMFYYRGLSQWKRERGFLRDTCLAAQDTYKTYLDYFKIPYSE